MEENTPKKRENKKPLFFAMEIISPWQDSFPDGRVIDEPFRHLTLAFIGSLEEKKNEDLFSYLPFLNDEKRKEKKGEKIPLPSFTLGPCGFFDKELFLPKKDPRLVAWHMQFFDKEKEVFSYRETLVSFLNKKGLIPDPSEKGGERKFLPHMTICRSPQSFKEWKQTFLSSSFFFRKLHLFESLGFSKYRSLWSFDFIPPFEEIEHTGEAAYIVRGNSLEELFLHAGLALSFDYAPFVSFIKKEEKIVSLSDLIGRLNRILAEADEKIGVPFKAVSFHGETIQDKRGFLEWEMIVDV